MRGGELCHLVVGNGHSSLREGPPDSFAGELVGHLTMLACRTDAAGSHLRPRQREDR